MQPGDTPPGTVPAYAVMRGTFITNLAVGAHTVVQTYAFGDGFQGKVTLVVNVVP